MPKGKKVAKGLAKSGLFDDLAGKFFKHTDYGDVARIAGRETGEAVAGKVGKEAAQQAGKATNKTLKEQAEAALKKLGKGKADLVPSSGGKTYVPDTSNPKVKKAVEQATEAAKHNRQWDPAKAAKSKKNASRPGVIPGESGPYKELNARAKSWDGLSHDHIPSKASLKEYAEQQLGRKLSPSEAKQIDNMSITVAVPDQWHSQLNPTSTMNTPEMIAGDAKDLVGATERGFKDYEVLIGKDKPFPDQETFDAFMEPQKVQALEFLQDEKWWKQFKND